VTSRIGAVAALPAERRTLTPIVARSSRWVAVRGGMGAAAARTAAERLVADGASLLVSWGCAGGLATAMRPGTLVLAESVIARDGARWPADTEALGRLRARMTGDLTWRAGVLAETNTVLVDPVAKRALARATGAIAADMESAAIGRVAAAAGIPFLALRAIADGVDQALPHALAAAPDGGIGAWLPLLASPATWPRLWRMGHAYRAACGSLAALARSDALTDIEMMPARPVTRS